jgi:class 3 adenylate cyclase
MGESNVERKLSAIMFTDIVGYSKMMGLDETGTLLFLKFHDTLIREEIAKNSGKVIKTVGDSFMADFSSAVNAVRCAVAIQKRFLIHNRATGEGRQIRIGIHVGDVVLRDNDIYGDGVNIAARLQPLADPGGICISADVFHHLNNKTEFKVVSLGAKELKNISQKVEVYRIVMEGLVKNGRSKGHAGLVFFILLVLLGAGWYLDGMPGLPPDFKMPNLPFPFFQTMTPTPSPSFTPTATYPSTLTPTPTPTASPTATARPTSTSTPLSPKRPPVKKKAKNRPAPKAVPAAVPPPSPTPTPIPKEGVDVPPPPDTDVPAVKSYAPPPTSTETPLPAPEAPETLPSIP